MSDADHRAQLIARAQAHALAQELGRRGFTATVVRTRDHRLNPCVHIAGRRGWYRDEYIYAASADDGWWFWWSSLDPIAPVSDITATADKITSGLTPALAACRAAGAPLPQPVLVPVLAVPAGDPGHPRRASTGRTSHAS
jgi:hypothetical protein